MLKFISLAFGRVPKPREPQVSIDPQVARNIVATHSHGNVRLQDGRYYTKADVDAEYKKIRDVQLAL